LPIRRATMPSEKRALDSEDSSRKRAKLSTFYDFSATDLSDAEFQLSSLKGKLVLIENVATL